MACPRKAHCDGLKGLGEKHGWNPTLVDIVKVGGSSPLFPTSENALRNEVSEGRYFCFGALQRRRYCHFTAIRSTSNSGHELVHRLSCRLIHARQKMPVEVIRD